MGQQNLRSCAQHRCERIHICWSGSTLALRRHHLGSEVHPLQSARRRRVDPKTPRSGAAACDGATSGAEALAGSILRAMKRDKAARRTGRSKVSHGTERAECLKLVEEQFGKPWAEIEPELRELQYLHDFEVQAWNAWRELGEVLRRIERLAYADDGPDRKSAAAATEKAKGRIAFANAFPRGVVVVGDDGARRVVPERPPGHPRVSNRRYLQDWIREFQPDRLLQWRDDDAAYVLKRLRSRIGDHRCLDELLQVPGIVPWPRTRALPAPQWEHPTQWIVSLSSNACCPSCQPRDRSRLARWSPSMCSSSTQRTRGELWRRGSERHGTATALDDRNRRDADRRSTR